MDLFVCADESVSVLGSVKTIHQKLGQKLGHDC